MTNVTQMGKWRAPPLSYAIKSKWESADSDFTNRSIMSSSEETPSALFSSDDTSLAEGFRDKVAALHSHFDRDKDGFLNHSELRGLQLLTSGEDMNIPTYLMACKSIGCDPQKGISLDGLRLVYAADGSDVEEDYNKVFAAKPEDPAKSTGKEKEDDDDVLEVGEDGVDISS